MIKQHNRKGAGHMAKATILRCCNVPGILADRGFIVVTAIAAYGSHSRAGVVNEVAGEAAGVMTCRAV